MPDNPDKDPLVDALDSLGFGQGAAPTSPQGRPTRELDLSLGDILDLAEKGVAGDEPISTADDWFGVGHEFGFRDGMARREIIEKYGLNDFDRHEHGRAIAAMRIPGYYPDRLTDPDLKLPPEANRLRSLLNLGKLVKEEQPLRHIHKRTEMVDWRNPRRRKIGRTPEAEAALRDRLKNDPMLNAHGLDDDEIDALFQMASHEEIVIRRAQRMFGTRLTKNQIDATRAYQRLGRFMYKGKDGTTKLRNITGLTAEGLNALAKSFLDPEKSKQYGPLTDEERVARDTAILAISRAHTRSEESAKRGMMMRTGFADADDRKGRVLGLIPAELETASAWNTGIQRVLTAGSMGVGGPEFWESVGVDLDVTPEDWQRAYDAMPAGAKIATGVGEFGILILPGVGPLNRLNKSFTAAYVSRMERKLGQEILSSGGEAALAQARQQWALAGQKVAMPLSMAVMNGTNAAARGGDMGDIAAGAATGGALGWLAPAATDKLIGFMTSKNVPPMLKHIVAETVIDAGVTSGFIAGQKINNGQPLTWEEIVAGSIVSLGFGITGGLRERGVNRYVDVATGKTRAPKGARAEILAREQLLKAEHVDTDPVLADMNEIVDALNRQQIEDVPDAGDPIFTVDQVVRDFGSDSHIQGALKDAAVLDSQRAKMDEAWGPDAEGVLLDDADLPMAALEGTHMEDGELVVSVSDTEGNVWEYPLDSVQGVVPRNRDTRGRVGLSEPGPQEPLQRLQDVQGSTPQKMAPEPAQGNVEPPRVSSVEDAPHMGDPDAKITTIGGDEGKIQVAHDRPGQRPSITNWVVPEEGRGRGTGKALHAAAAEAFPDLQGQYSNDRSAKIAYDQGFRPVDEEGVPIRDATFEDVQQRIKDDTSVLMARPEAASAAVEPPKPQRQGRKKNMERFGVDKGGTVVGDALVWKDDSNGMWTVSYPEGSGKPDRTTAANTSAEAVALVQAEAVGPAAPKAPSAEPHKSDLKAVGAAAKRANPDQFKGRWSDERAGRAVFEQDPEQFERIGQQIADERAMEVAAQAAASKASWVINRHGERLIETAGTPEFEAAYEAFRADSGVRSDPDIRDMFEADAQEGGLDRLYDATAGHMVAEAQQAKIEEQALQAVQRQQAATANTVLGLPDGTPTPREDPTRAHDDRGTPHTQRAPAFTGRQAEFGATRGLGDPGEGVPELTLNTDVRDPDQPFAGEENLPVGQHHVMQAVSEAGQVDLPTASDVREGRTRRGLRGQFNVFTHVRRVHEADDIRGAIHETGHAVEESFLGSPHAGARVGDDAAIIAELDVLAKRIPAYAENEPDRPAGSARGWTSEGVAELAYLAMAKRAEAEQLAPNALKAFDAWVSADAKRAKAWGRVAKLVEQYGTQNPFQRFIGNVEFGRVKGEGLIPAVRRFFSTDNWVDSMAPLARLVDLAKANGANLKPHENPWILAQVLRQAHGSMASRMIESGIRSPDGHMITNRGVADAFKIVGDREMEFIAYLGALRSRERINKARRNGGTTPRDGRTVAPMSAAEADAIIKAVAGSKFADDFSEAAKIIHEFNDGLLQYMQDWGAIPHSMREQLLAGSKNYIPFERVWDGEVKPGDLARSLAGGNPIKRFKGSARRIRDPISVMVERTTTMLRVAHEQAIRNAVVNIATMVPGMGKFIEEVPVETRVLGENMLGNFKSQLKKQGLDLGRIEERARQLLDELRDMDDLSLIGRAKEAFDQDHESGFEVGRTFRAVKRPKRGVGHGQRRVKQDPKVVKAEETLLDLGDGLEKLRTREDLIDYITKVEGLPYNDTQEMILTWFAPKEIPGGKDPIIPIVDADGERRWFHVNPDVYRAISSVEAYQLNKLARIFALPTDVIRASTTSLNPAFALVTNPLRDTFTYFVQSGSNSPVEMAQSYIRQMVAAVGNEGFGELFGVQPSEAMEIFRTWGGEVGGEHAEAGMVSFESRARRKARGSVIPEGGVLRNPAQFGRNVKGRVKRTFKVAGQTIREANNVGEVLGAALRSLLGTASDAVNIAQSKLGVTESVPRAAELEIALKESGWRPGDLVTRDQMLSAMLRAKQVTVDFSAAGHIAGILNRFIPFFNVQIQGPRAFGRALKNNPAGTIIKGLVAYTIPTIMGYDDVKDQPFWDELSPEERFRYLYFVVPGTDEVIRLPMAHEAAPLFVGLPLMVMEGMRNSDSRAFEGFMASFVEGYVPGVDGTMVKGVRDIADRGSWVQAITSLNMPQIMAPAVEMGFNWSGYRGRPIVSRRLEGRPVREQFSAFTSGSARAIAGDPESEEGFEASPALIDYMVSAYGGPLARDLFHWFGPSDAASQGTLSEGMFKRRLFLRGGTTGSESESFTRLNEDLDSMNRKARSEFLKETDAEKRRRMGFTWTQRKIIRMLRDGQTMEEDERRAITRRIRAMTKEAQRRAGTHSFEMKRQQEMRMQSIKDRMQGK